MSAILAAILDFSKILFSAKLQQISLKLVENMCLQPQIGIKFKNWVEKKKLEQILSKSYSLDIQTLICIIKFT